jgi:hypothetical protein
MGLFEFIDENPRTIWYSFIGAMIVLLIIAIGFMIASKIKEPLCGAKKEYASGHREYKEGLVPAAIRSAEGVKNRSHPTENELLAKAMMGN